MAEEEVLEGAEGQERPVRNRVPGGNPVVVGGGSGRLGGRRIGIAAGGDEDGSHHRALHRGQEHHRQQRGPAEPRADRGEEPDVAPAHRLALEEPLTEERDGGKAGESRGGPDGRVCPGEPPVPDRREQAGSEKRPGDLMRQEPAVQIDVGQRHQSRHEDEVSEGGPAGPCMPQHRNCQDPHQQLDQRIAHADGQAAAAAAAAQQDPGKERNVVVPGDGVAAVGTAAPWGDDAPTLGNARDHHVEEAAHHGPGDEDPDGDEDRHAAGEFLHSAPRH